MRRDVGSFITSLSVFPKLMTGAAGRHWSVEGFHRSLDMIFHEDARGVGRGNVRVVRQAGPQPSGALEGQARGGFQETRRVAPAGPARLDGGA